MPVIRKQILAPATIIAEDRDGKPLAYNVTPAEIDRLYTEGKDMLKRGLSIPVPLEHQDGAKPVTAADRKAASIKNNAGWVQDFVRLNGQLYADLDIPDAKLAKKLPSTIKFVSPDIDSFIDPTDGKKRERVITHVALTLRPRWVDQEPFKSAGKDGAVLMSLASPPTEIGTAAGPIRLSMAAAATATGDKWKLADPAQLRIRLGTDGEIPPESEKPPEAEQLPEENPEGEEDAGELLSQVREALAGCGIQLRDDVPTEPLKVFLEHLLTAIQAHKGTAGDGDLSELQADDVNEEPHSMLMSIEKLSKHADPAVQVLAKGYRKRAQAGLESRLKLLKGHLPDEVHKKLTAKLPESVLRLSINSESDELAPSPLEETLDIIEQSIPDLTIRLSAQRLREEGQPVDGDEKEMAKAREEMVAIAKRGQPQKRGRKNKEE